MRFLDALALNASAGSGKTFALSVRYIALLLMGVNPANIIALTFTKKAANEMQHRVYQTLQELESKQSELNELCKLLQIEKKEILARKERILPLFLQANIKISTIDAFFGQILRKFALHAGLMPDFASKEFHNQNKFKEAFIKAVKTAAAYKQLLSFTLKSNKNINYFFEILSCMYEKNSEIDEWKFTRTTPPNPLSVEEIAQEMKSYLIQIGAANRAAELFSKKPQELIKSDFLAKNTLLEHSYFKKSYTPKMDELFFNLKNAVKEFHEANERYFLGELFYLFKIYKNTLKNISAKSKELSFEDITNAVYELLYRHVDSDFLYFRLDAKIEHLLIDEFQDTNIAQYKILEPIIKEITAGIGTKEFKSFFYVGDMKQAIYRFRGGTKELFSHIVTLFDINVSSLKYNYRSQKLIVEFVNEVFGDKIANYEPQIAHEANGGGFVEVKSCEEVKEGIVRSIKKLLENGAAADDIAVLCNTNKDAMEIKEAIVEAFADIPVCTDGHKLLIKSANVAAILEFLKYLYFKDELYGRNFSAFLGEDADKLPNTRDFDINAAPLELVKKCIDEFGIPSSADVIGFLEIMPRYNDIESLLFAYEDIREHSFEGGEGIRALTVHKSKGLEFSFVIVADKLQKENNSEDQLLFDYDGIELKRLFLRASKRELTDELYKNAKEKDAALESEDELNCFYVAFTRAKNGLIIVQKNEKSSFERLSLQDTIRGKIEAKSEEKKSAALSVQYEGKSFGKQNVKSEKEPIEANMEDICFGLALHFTLEMMNDFSESELETALISAKNRYGSILDKNAFISIKRKVSRLINNGEFQNLFKSGKFYKEQPYVFEGERRQIDILIEKDDEVVIIDYKSSSYAKESHVKQVLEYKKAIEFISRKRVKSYLYYLHEKEIEIINLE
ncbi:MAG: RecB-like helicase [Campylobacteraceae bacterium]|jgi:ATP-dependent exoDNAse (exonuclease V) beta subunit|nr:RecB-like helicase [Campylobacteraceae bacterium]